MDDSAYVEVDGKTLRLSHLSKVLFPEDGITKAELLFYYQTVAHVLLPHLRGRPLTMKAFPNGGEGATVSPSKTGLYHTALAQ